MSSYGYGHAQFYFELKLNLTFLTLKITFSREVKELNICLVSKSLKHASTWTTDRAFH